jgi:hypothetical protein
MKRLPIIAALLLVAAVAFANPFVGRWICDGDRYQITSDHIRGVMDGHPYDSAYTFTDRTWTWKDRAWVYLVVDDDHLLVAGINFNGQPWYWMLSRDNTKPPSGT